MIIISRRRGQRLYIGNDIEIVVSAVHRSNVKLAIRAPRNVPVLRGELLEPNVATDAHGPTPPAHRDPRRSRE